MKRCPKCNQTYTDETLNFCLNDGDMLSAAYSDEPPTIISGQANPRFDDSPPTVMMNQTRVTNPTGWQPGAPVGQWQGQTTPSAMPRQFGMMPRSLDQTLPTIALILGILAMPMICCYGGIWLGLPALVVGYFGMKNADNDPSRYGGRGLAIGGMIMGGIMLLISAIHIILAVFFGVLSSIPGR